MVKPDPGVMLFKGEGPRQTRRKGEGERELSRTKESQGACLIPLVPAVLTCDLCWGITVQRTWYCPGMQV